MIRSLWYTNAPESYDYAYVETVGSVEVKGEIWREILVSDAYRFQNYQTPRYNSGLYVTLTPHQMVGQAFA